MVDSPPYPGTPRWVKVTGIVVGILVLLVAIIVFAGVGGPHGPGRHASHGEAGGHGWGLLMLLGVLVLSGVALNWGWLVDRGLPHLGRSIARRWPLSPRTARVPIIMPTRLRKLVLIAHVVSSVGSLGAVAVFLVLAVAGLTSQDAQMMRAAYIANGIIAWYIILPLILIALLIGVVQSLGTPWGLFRHYWVLAKLLLTIVTIYVLLTQLEGISYIAGVSAETTLSSADLLGLRRSMRTHAAGGLVVLLVLVAFSIYKPQGMTRYGWRKQQAARSIALDPGRAAPPSRLSQMGNQGEIR